MGPRLPQSSSSDRLRPRTRHHCPPSPQAQGRGPRLGPAAGSANLQGMCCQLPAHCAPTGPRKPGLSHGWGTGGHLDTSVLGNGACV